MGGVDGRGYDCQLKYTICDACITSCSVDQLLPFKFNDAINTGCNHLMLMNMAINNYHYQVSLMRSKNLIMCYNKYIPTIIVPVYPLVYLTLL